MFLSISASVHLGFCPSQLLDVSGMTNCLSDCNALDMEGSAISFQMHLHHSIVHVAAKKDHVCNSRV